MKKEVILNIVSAIVVIGAIIMELFNSVKETGELSLRSLLMNTSVSVINQVSTDDGSLINKSTELLMWD